MVNHWWTTKDNEDQECAECIHFCDIPGQMYTFCLRCRHCYNADTEEDAQSMDYYKKDYFERKQKETTE